MNNKHNTLRPSLLCVKITQKMYHYTIIIYTNTCFS